MWPIDVIEQIHLYTRGAPPHLYATEQGVTETIISAGISPTLIVGAVPGSTHLLGKHDRTRAHTVSHAKTKSRGGPSALLVGILHMSVYRTCGTRRCREIRKQTPGRETAGGPRSLQIKCTYFRVYPQSLICAFVPGSGTSNLLRHYNTKHTLTGTGCQDMLGFVVLRQVKDLR